MKIFEEIRDISGEKFEIIALSGYIFAAFNISLSFSLIFKFSFSFYIFLLLIFVLFILNFIFSAITSLYIDMQVDNSFRMKDIFYFYGITYYLSFLLLPAVYFYLYKGSGIYFFLIIFFFLWLSRLLFIKHKTSFGFINSFVAIFFPYMLVMVLLFLFLITLSILSFIYLYG